MSALVLLSVGPSHVSSTCLHGLRFYQEYVDNQGTVLSLLNICFARAIQELAKAHYSWLIPITSLINFWSLACPNQHLNLRLPELLACPFLSPLRLLLFLSMLQAQGFFSSSAPNQVNPFLKQSCSFSWPPSSCRTVMTMTELGAGWYEGIALEAAAG